MAIIGSWISKLIKVLGLVSPFLYIYAKIYDHNDFVKIVNFRIIYIEREREHRKEDKENGKEDKAYVAYIIS